MTIAATKKGAQKNKVYFEFNPYDTELTNALFDKTLENYKKNRENQENRIKIVNYYEIFKNEYDKDIGILDEKNRVKNKVKELIPMVISEIKQYSNTSFFQEKIRRNKYKKMKKRLFSWIDFGLIDIYFSNIQNILKLKLKTISLKK